MKIIYYFYSGFNTTFFGILLDEVKKKLENNHNEVYIAVCQGFYDSCILNPQGNTLTCRYCSKFTVARIKKHLGPKIRIINLKDYRKDNFIDFNYSNSEDLKKIQYKSAKIGYSTLSSYIQISRNQNPLIDSSSKIYFDHQINQAIKLVDAFENLIEEIKPDCVVSYNGRFNEIRPIFDTCKRLNVNVEMLEAAPSMDGKLYKVSFKNVLPHNVKDNLWRIEKTWNNPDLEEGENLRLANQFYKNRRDGAFAGDKVYIGNQAKGLLPENWNPKKRNIAIFNSSEDEFVAIGDEYEELALFPNQYTGLNAIFEKYKDNSEIHFHLRIHPNLKNVNYKYHTELYSFPEKYKNVTVISPSSAISTYDLMEASEKIIVFGSTMGIESAYWGKPTILLNCALYYYADVCYIPKTPDELFENIDNILSPKRNDNIYKYGLYYYDKSSTFIDRNSQFEYIDFNPVHLNIGRLNLRSSNFLKILGSPKLAAIYFYSKRLFIKLISKNKFNVPLNEQ